MGNLDLKYRTRFSTSVDKEILKAFDKYAKESGRTKSRLVDIALLDLLKKYGKEINREDRKKDENGAV